MGEVTQAELNEGIPEIDSNGVRTIKFVDFPEFRPNLTPREVMKRGSFGGTYWRPIHSSVTGKDYKNVHLTYPEDWWKGIPKNYMVRPWNRYSEALNTYGVSCGTTLEFWEGKDWIKSYHPYGWFHWYCDFYMGKRCPDDKRQI